MVVEEIVNEIDKFITKYKALKSDNQTLTQFKSDVKTALNNKGIISTNEDSEVVNSVNSYNPPTGGGATLDANYLKSKGLLSNRFSGTPTVEDLKSTQFIIQNPTNDSEFLSSEGFSTVGVTLDGVRTSDYVLDREGRRDNTSIIDDNKFIITNSGYYVNKFKFNKKGTYKVSLGINGVNLERNISYDPSELKSMDGFLIYAVNMKTGKIAVRDETTNVEMTGFVDKSKLGTIMSGLVRKVDDYLNGMGNNTEKFGYVCNLRTGIAKYLNVIWDSKAFANIDSNKRKSLSNVVYNNMIEILTDRYSFALHTVSYNNSGNMQQQNINTFISDIDYKDGDTLVFALYKELFSNNKVHGYPELSVANYLKSLFKDTNLGA